MIRSSRGLLISSVVAIAALLAGGVATGKDLASGNTGRGWHSGRNQNSTRDENSGCPNWHHGHCHGSHKRLRDSREARDRHRHNHGDRANGWRNASGGFCRGQRGCNSGTGTGYRGLASGLLSAAQDLNNQVQKLRESQRQIAQTSISEEPGPRSPDARGFNAANENGQSRLSRYADQASDPIVKDQAETYDLLGEEIAELEEEAQKYEQQAEEMNQLADKAERNADHLGTKNAVNGTAGDRFGAGGTDSPNGYLASDPSARLEKNPDGKGKSGSQITREELDKLSDPSFGKGPASGPYASYPTAAANASGNGSGAGNRFSPQGGIRDEIRARLKDKYGREPTGEEISRVADAAGRAGSLAALEKAGFVDKDGKPLLPPAAGSPDDTVASFSKGLGDPRLEIAASETEASVRAMLSSLAASGDRRPASALGAGIGYEDGPSLFERCRATHVRCQKAGCVGRAGG